MRVVVQWEALLPAGYPAAPLLAVGLLEPLHRADDLGDHLTAVADDRNVGASDLAELGRVDVDVDDLRLGSERRDLSGDPVVEARPQRYEKVGFLHRRDRRVVAV